MTAIQVNDLVKVVNPLVVVRVGYPLTISDGMDAAESQWSKYVYALMKEVGATDDPLSAEYDSRLYCDVINALASYYVRSKGFGGKERSIYTDLQENLRGTSGWRVASKRRVKTGTYCPAHFDSYFEEHTPAYLSNEVTHTLLSLEHPEHWFIEIKTTNVEKQEKALSASGAR